MVAYDQASFFAYCLFPFHWPQFAGNHALNFAARESDTLVRYLQVVVKLFVYR